MLRLGRRGQEGVETEAVRHCRAGGYYRPAEVLLHQVGVHVAELYLQELHQGQNGLGRGSSMSGSGPFGSHLHPLTLTQKGNRARSFPAHLCNVCRADPGPSGLQPTGLLCQEPARPGSAFAHAVPSHRNTHGSLSCFLEILTQLLPSE